jgi:hypothetical protein
MNRINLSLFQSISYKPKVCNTPSSILKLSKQLTNEIQPILSNLYLKQTLFDDLCSKNVPFNSFHFFDEEQSKNKKNNDDDDYDYDKMNNKPLSKGKWVQNINIWIDQIRKNSSPLINGIIIEHKKSNE